MPTTNAAVTHASVPHPTEVDEAHVRCLLDEHGRALMAFATRLTGDRWAAEDAVQETLVRAWRHRTDLVERAGSVRGWLLTVLRNVVVDGARARSVRPREVPQEWAQAPLKQDHAEHVVDSLVVHAALSTLPAQQRAVVEHLYLRAASVVETAQALGIPAGTVKSRSYYALHSMREYLAARPDTRTGTGAGQPGQLVRRGRAPSDPACTQAA